MTTFREIDAMNWQSEFADETTQDAIDVLVGRLQRQTGESADACRMAVRQMVIQRGIEAMMGELSP